MSEINAEEQLKTKKNWTNDGKKLTKNSKELENKVDKKYGQSIYMRKLDDQTIIQYKKASKSWRRDHRDKF